MSGHLSSDKISAILIGDGAPGELSHARECAMCGAEVEKLSAALGLFRESVQEMSERRACVAVESHRGAAWVSSLAIHAAAIAGIVVIGSIRPVMNMVQPVATYLIAPPLRPYVEKLTKGGGGGGGRSSIDASKGALPKTSPRPFTPPRVDPVESKLPMTPTIVADAPLPKIDAANFGDPLGRLGVPSNGSGWGGGIGIGIDGGVGVGKGPGAGPGTNGGFGDGAYRAGGGVSSPVVLLRVEPEYSEEARRAKWQGVVELQIVVDERGVPQQMRVMRSLGLGLDEKATEAVAKWRFKPGMKNGKPVPVIAVIQVTFRLL